MRVFQLFQHFPLLSLRHRDPNIPVHRHRRSWQGSLALFPSCRKRWYSSWFRDPYASQETEGSWPPSRKFPFVWIHQQRRWFFPCHQISAETSWPVRTEKSILGKRFIHSLRGRRLKGKWKEKQILSAREAPLLPRARSRLQIPFPFFFERLPRTLIYSQPLLNVIYIFLFILFCFSFFPRFSLKTKFYKITLNTNFKPKRFNS